MARVIYICQRHPDGDAISDRAVLRLSRMLTPDNIVPHPPRVIRARGLALVLINPGGTVAVQATSICLGAVFGSAADWWVPGRPAPDGSYAIFRGSETTIELVSDTLASRTIWYVLTERALIASTSQRAIVSLLGSFESNPQALTWLVSSGSLGPDNAWDARIRSLLPDSRLRLDRDSWKLAVTRVEPRFEPVLAAQAQHRRGLERAIEQVFEGLPLDGAKWILPLSGGVDSRAILLMLNKEQRVDCVTWGLRSSLADPESDSAVAARLSGHLDVPHRFCPTDLTTEPIERMLHRFLVAGEGRADRISGYMDGFAIWKQLFEDGYDGVLRGDEVFGWHEVRSEVDTRRYVGLTLLSDYANLRRFQSDMALQVIPPRLRRSRSESLPTWRDRLYQDYRVPVLLSALNDLKCAYVEILNPLLARAIVMRVRTLPDRLRTEKPLLRAIVAARSPDIPFATRDAIQAPVNILQSRDAVALFRDELSSSASALPRALVRHVLANLAVLDPQPSPRTERPGKGGLQQSLRSRLQRPLARLRYRLLGEPLDYHVIALRLLIAARMFAMLGSDASSLRDER